MKPLIWLGDSRDFVRRLPDVTRQVIGYGLDRIQHGTQPTDFKPMPGIGLGVYEMRVHTEREYRVIYVARFIEAIYVLHGFVKKSQRTPMSDINLAATRYRALLKMRKAK